MSARTPFFNPKPGLLNTNTPPAGSAQDTHKDSESNPNPNSKPNTDANEHKSPPAQPQPQPAAQPNEPLKLNVAGLLGRRTQLGRRGSQDIPRPGTADPFKPASEQQQQQQQRKLTTMIANARQGSFPPRILAPAPRPIPINPPFVSQSNSNANAPKPEDLNTLSFSAEDHFSYDSTNAEQSFLMISSSNSDVSSDSINYMQQQQQRRIRTPAPLNLSNHNQPPRRVPLEPLELSGDGSLNLSFKRRVEDAEGADDGMGERAQKRFRGDPQLQTQPFTPPGPGHNDYHASKFTEHLPEAQYPESSPEEYAPQQQHHRPQRGYQQQQQVEYPQPQQVPALDRVLGRSVDAYISEHMEQYDCAVKRWKECSMEEWIKGADEISGKYTKIIDFVKNHMNTKIKLFATFDAQIDAHNKSLDERAAALAGAKERLVKEGGNVLGGASIQPTGWNQGNDILSSEGFSKGDLGLSGD